MKRPAVRQSHRAASLSESDDALRVGVAALVAGVLVAVPLAMSTSMLNVYTTPKYLVLVVGGALLCPLLVARALGPPGSRSVFVSPFAFALFLLLAALGLASIASADPRLSFFGTFTSRMGWLTYAAYAAIALAIVSVADRDRTWFGRLFVWQTAVGGIVAFVCVLQILGATSVYPSDFLLGETIPRVHGTVGHPDFAGNYLLTIVFPALCIAFAARGIVRGLGMTVAAMSTIGILYTGTRGAWVGLLAGAAVGAAFAWRTRLLGDVSPRGKRLLALGSALFAVTATLMLAFSPSAEPIRQRMAAFANEGFTGAGRTVVWQFTLGLVPEFWTIGCGPDLFKLAQTPFKTLDYVQATSGVNVEDPHNAFLSMLVNGGVLAVGAYVAVILLAVRRLPRAIQSATSREESAIGIGLAAAVTGILTHDFFLHHLAVNGHSFFVVLALAHAWGNMPDRNALPAASTPATRSRPLAFVRWTVATAVALMIPIAAVHAWRVGAADVQLSQSLRASNAGDARTAVAAGERAVAHGLPQPDYRFYFAMSLERLARSSADAAARQRFFEAAAYQSARAVEQPLPPVPYVAFASALATSAGWFEEGHASLDRAERLDPFSYHVDLSAIQLLVAEGRIDEAIGRFDRLELMRSPHGEVDKARTLLRKAIRARPGPRTEIQLEFLRREYLVTGARNKG